MVTLERRKAVTLRYNGRGSVVADKALSWTHATFIRMYNNSRNMFSVEWFPTSVFYFIMKGRRLV